MAYVRKALRASSASAHERFAKAQRIAFRAMNGPSFEYKDGYKIRIWGDGCEDYVTDDDVRNWLSGIRVLDDIRDGLQFVRQSYIDKMIREDYIRKMDGHYWITAKAAQRFNLQKVMGCEFPK